MKLEIEIDDPTRCYSAGQTVRGHVLVLSTTGAKIQGVTIKCIGRVSTKWTSGYGKNRKRRYERVLYFTNVQQHTTNAVPVGSTKFPFQFKLPSGTPSSFNGRYGHVVYFIEAVVERSWKSNVSTRQYFSFNATVDLNTYPGAALPMIGYKERTSFTFFCGRGLISARINFPRSGYVGGQPLDFVLEVKNFSARNIPKVNLSLMQDCTFKAQTHERRTENRVLDITFDEGVPQKDERIFLGSVSEYKIPPLPPTQLGGCALINVTYNFQLKVSLSGEAPIVCTLPVVIGTIPLREMFHSMLPAPGEARDEQSTAPPDIATAPSFNELDAQPATAPGYIANGLYPDLPPPSYHEAVMSGGAGTSNFEDDQPQYEATAPSASDLNGDEGDSYFTPKYTMYKWKN